MKLFEVEITTRAVVAAECWDSAYVTAIDSRREMIGDDYDIEIVNEIVQGSLLPTGWCEGAYPYGVPAVKSIKEILEEQ